MLTINQMKQLSVLGLRFYSSKTEEEAKVIKNNPTKEKGHPRIVKVHPWGSLQGYPIHEYKLTNVLSKYNAVEIFKFLNKKREYNKALINKGVFIETFDRHINLLGQDGADIFNDFCNNRPRVDFPLYYPNTPTWTFPLYNPEDTTDTAASKLAVCYRSQFIPYLEYIRNLEQSIPNEIDVIPLNELILCIRAGIYNTETAACEGFSLLFS